MKELNFEQMAQVEGGLGGWCMDARDLSAYSLEQLVFETVYWNGNWWLDGKEICS